MKPWLTSVCVLFVALAHDAQAECAAPYTAGSLANDLGAMSAGLRGGDRDAFKVAGASLSRGLPCVDAPLAPVVLASVYRYVGLQEYFTGDTAKAQGWFRSALELDSSFDWDINELPINDPIRVAFEAEREAAGVERVAVVGGRELAVPDGGRLTADGRALTEATLTPDRPHLIQWMQISDNSVVQVWIVEGAELPDALLGGARDRSSTVQSGGSFAVEKIERSRPPLKTPMIILGGVGLAGGIGMYAMSFGAHKQFQKATTTAELEKKRSLTNGLVMGAGGAIAVGSGLTYLGVMLDGGTGLRLYSVF
jgi:hypothetical protein